MNKVYKFFLTISSTLWFLAIWMIWYLFNLPKCEDLKFEICLWLGCIIIVAIPVVFFIILKNIYTLLLKRRYKKHPVM